jgi:predicted aspartyl protease
MYFIRFYFTLIAACCFSLAVAQNRTFDILNGRNKIEVPFSFTHNFIIVEVRLFGMMPMNFIFDTGAESTILFTRQFADFLNINYDLRIPIIGSDLSQKLYALVARSIEFELVGLPSQKKDILVLEENPFNLSEITGIQIHGLLGASFFKNSVIEIDYKRQKLIFHNPMNFKPPGRSYTKINVEILGNKPYLQANSTLMNGTSVNLKLLVDTGAGLPLLLHTNTHPSLVLPDHYILGELGIGLGGLIEGYMGRTSKLSIEDIVFDNVLTSFQDISKAVTLGTIWPRNGLIGNQILSRFDVIIDFVREELYLRPKRRFNRKFKMDKSGLILIAIGPDLNNYMVRGTISGSPSENAGLLRGDRLVRINGILAKVYTLDYIQHILQKRVGKRIKLVVYRNGQTLKLRFYLRDLI